ncbi:hypothetical protein [Allocoleopsis sp.]|uniref:hypothetical protein n=1 Tax=Allocoleopsis sp. TaxID=3088169 RepID=UPI002FD1DF64
MATYIFTAPSTNSAIEEKTAEIKNVSWQKVPDTASTEEGYTDPAFIDINGINRNKDLVIFDVVNPDASYGRVEGNCTTNLVRSLRLGSFLSSTKISYIEQNNLALSQATPYQINLLKLACHASGKQ